MINITIVIIPLAMIVFKIEKMNVFVSNFSIYFLRKIIISMM